MAQVELSLEQEILRAARHSIVKLFGDGSLVAPDYANRVKVPADLAKRVYDLIDYNEVLAQLKPKINEMVANRILGSLTEELGNDVKQTLCHGPTRLRLRMVVAQELDAIKSEAK